MGIRALSRPLSPLSAIAALVPAPFLSRPSHVPFRGRAMTIDEAPVARPLVIAHAHVRRRC